MSQNLGGYCHSPAQSNQWLLRICCVVVTTLVAAMLLGCTADGARTDENLAPGNRSQHAPALPDLPAPSALKLGSFTEAGLVHLGPDYAPQLPYANISVVEPDLQFDPHWENNQSPPNSLAYAGYGFDLAGYDRDSTVRLEWAVAPPAASSWIGLADFSRDRWLWLQPDAAHTVTADFAALLDGGTTLVAIVLITGTQQCGLASIRVGTPPDAPWPMYGCDSQHSRRSTAAGPSAPHLAWSFRTTGPGFLFSEPAFGADGTIYLGSGSDVGPFSENPEVTALNPDGTLKWRSARIVPRTPVTVAQDGTLYVGSLDAVYALDPQGEILWRYGTTDTPLSPLTLTADGEILYGSYDNEIYCINPDGTLRWSFDGGGSSYCIYGRPVLAADGTIYFGSEDGHLYALHPDGSLKWSFDTLGQIWSTPLLGPEGTIYFGNNASTMFALNPDGTLLWEYDAAPDEFVMSPALGPDASIYVASVYQYDDRQGTLHALNPDGTLQWHAPFGWLTWNSPAVASDGTVFLGDGAGMLSAFSPAGDLLWTYSETDTVQSSVVSIPRFGPDDTIYIACYNNTFHAITPAGALKWKFTGGGWIESEPVVDAQGTAYFNCMDRKIYAVNADGTLKWTFKTPDYVRNSPAVANDGTVYVACWNGSIYAVDSAGNLLWEYQSASGQYITNFTPMVIAEDGAVTVAYEDSTRYNVVTLNPDGSVRWKYLGANRDAYSLLLHPNGNRLCGTANSLDAITDQGAHAWSQAFEAGAAFNLLAAAPGGTIFSRAQGAMQTYDANGTPGWSSSAADFSYVNEIAVNPQGGIYAGRWDDYGASGSLDALNPDGTLQWSIPDGPYGAPALDNAGNLYSIREYFNAPEGTRYFLTATAASGARQWELELPVILTGAYTPPVIGTGHMLYVGGSDGRLYAISD